MNFKEECINKFESIEKEKKEKYNIFIQEQIKIATDYTKERFKKLFNIHLQNHHFHSVLVDGIKQFTVIYEGVALQININRNINNNRSYGNQISFYMVIPCKECGKYTSPSHRILVLCHDSIGSFLVKEVECRICQNNRRKKRNEEINKKIEKDEKTIFKRFVSLIHDIKYSFILDENYGDDYLE